MERLSIGPKDHTQPLILDIYPTPPKEPPREYLSEFDHINLMLTNIPQNLNRISIVENEVKGQHTLDFFVIPHPSGRTLIHLFQTSAPSHLSEPAFMEVITRKTLKTIKKTGRHQNIVAWIVAGLYAHSNHSNLDIPGWQPRDQGSN
jgi:hypothetical protein